MKKILFVSLLATIAMAIVIGSLYVSAKNAKKEIETNSNENVDQESNDSGESALQLNNMEQFSFAEPIKNWRSSITLNGFGNEPSKMDLPADQYSDLVCSGGKDYPGYHTANDIEVTSEERNSAVPVYSVANGTVRQINKVSGYGGLAVIEYNINGQDYTAYYGHIDLSTAAIKAGDKVEAGQKIAELAPACSPANGNTRKHLHFGMHSGKSIAVAGYVNTKAELSNWVDPRDLIK
jgi:murein DD-endopeptidase MepM/ murein hydrolase activator NlpD